MGLFQGVFFRKTGLLLPAGKANVAGRNEKRDFRTVIDALSDWYSDG